MKIIELTQGTKEWLDWRRDGIGSSDIAGIMSVCEYSNPKKVYESKMANYKSKTTDAMRYGNEQEPLARRWLEKYFKCDFESYCVEDEEHSWMRSSFDAINLEEKILIEIKTSPSIKKCEKMKGGSIPKGYLYQLQWHLMVSKYEKGYLAIWDGKECTLFEKNHDESLHLDMYIEARKFWENLKKGFAPEDTSKKYENKDDRVDLLEKSARFKELSTLIKEAQKEKKEIETDLFAAGDNTDFIMHGIKYTQMPGKKTYDWDAIDEANIDLSPYKKEGKPYYRTKIIEV